LLNDFETFAASTAPTMSAIENSGLLVYRYGNSISPDVVTRFQRYDLGANVPQLEAEATLGCGSFVEDLGDVTIEQVWSRWDPRWDALAVTWQWFDKTETGENRFGSNPFLYTDDFGATWRLADGSEATLPLTYATIEPRISPYDHLALGEHSGWLPRDVGFGPNGTPWITLAVGDARSDWRLRFFRWDQARWESRALTDRMQVNTDAAACGAARDYLVCAYSELGTPGTLLVRVSRDDGNTWTAPVTVDSVGTAPDGSLQRINWVSFVQPADRYLDNSARFFVGYYKTGDGTDGLNYRNNIRWIRLQVGPRADFNGDQQVDGNDLDDFASAFAQDDWRADFNDDGVVDAVDDAAFRAAWNEETGGGGENQPPTARFNVQCTALSCSFDGSASSDNDGDIVSYDWVFGDSTSGTGATPTHAYANNGTYPVTLTVTDNGGATDSTSRNVTVSASSGGSPDTWVLGNAEANHAWTTVDSASINPAAVVIAGPPSFNGGDPGIVRLRNVTDSRFEVRFQEWDYRERDFGDTYHALEDIPYLVLTPGRYPMPNGAVWEVGSFNLAGTRSWQDQQFTQPFAAAPRLFLTVQSENDGQAVSVRARNVTASGFQAALYEEEALNDGHASETIGYLAIFSSSGEGDIELGGTLLSYQLQSIEANNAWSTVFNSQVEVEEEQSRDTEVAHTNETLHVLALDNALFAQQASSRGGDTTALRQR